MASPLLLDIGIVIIIATVLAYIARLLRQPLLVAYVVAGILIGPMGFGLITNQADIKILAELGIAFLLFTVGLEIDFKRLKSVGAASFIGGIVQMVVTFILGFGVAILMGFDPLVSSYIGLLMSFSSTMIVAKLLVDRNEIKTLHGRIMMGVLLMQDLIVILILPMFMNFHEVLSIDILSIIVIKGLGLFSIAIVLNRYVLKRVLDYAARSNEILFLTAVAVCFSFIGLAESLGFPIAIGAFLGGIALAEFPYTLEIYGEMHSLRDFFSVIFFVSLGMILTWGDIFGMMPLIVALLVITIFIKPLIISLVYLFLGYGGRTASIIGLGMGQASEFSFILAAQGLILVTAQGVPHISQELYTVFVTVIVTTMVITPYLMNVRNGIYSFISSRNITLFKRFGSPNHVKKLERHPDKELNNHIVIFGCDVMGGKVVDYLKEKKKPFIVAEHNPEVIRELSGQGVFNMYGNADNEDLLKEAGLYRARLAIVTIPDVETSGFVIGKAKRFNPSIKIYARAHSDDEAEALYRVGADFVVVPDFVSGGTLVRKIEHLLSGKKSHNPFKHLNSRK